MPVYLELFHGTESPDRSQLDGWGEQGPILGPLAYVHTTCAGDLKCCPLVGKNQPDESTCANLQVTCECLLYYDGVYYGDWSVTDGEWAKQSRENRRRFKQVDTHKAVPPPVVPKVKPRRTAKRGRKGLKV